MVSYHLLYTLWETMARLCPQTSKQRVVVRIPLGYHEAKPRLLAKKEYARLTAHFPNRDYQKVFSTRCSSFSPWCLCRFLPPGSPAGKPNHPKTHRIYSQVIRDFLKFDSDHIPTPMEVRTYLLAIAQRAAPRQPSTSTIEHSRHGLSGCRARRLSRKSSTRWPTSNLPKYREDSLSIYQRRDRQDNGSLQRRHLLRPPDAGGRLTFIDTGLRLFELANIQKNDIDVFEGIIKVMGKGQKERYVKIGLSTRVAIITIYCAGPTSCPLSG